MIKLYLASIEDEQTIDISATNFPDGSKQIWRLPDFVFYDQYKSYQIIWNYENDGELLQVLQLAELISTTKHLCPSLYMPFLPYGRQDKKTSNVTTFGLSTFLDILHKNRHLGSISTLDAHNANAITGIVHNIKPTAQIKYAIDAVKPDLIVFPDNGAANRAYNIQGLKSIVLDKKRNQLTGEIEGLVYNGETRVGDKSLLILDDLCDRGGTFIAAAKLLKSLDCLEINLYTTHGLYTGGTGIIKDSGIKRIFDKNGEIT